MPAVTMTTALIASILSAQDPLSATDMIAECNARAAMSGELRACIGEYTEACIAAAGDDVTNADMIGCASDEAAAWDGELNRAYRALRDSMAPTPAARLLTAQRAWIEMRDADCAYLASVFEGGSMAGLEHANCMLQATAERTITLESWDETLPPF